MTKMPNQFRAAIAAAMESADYQYKLGAAIFAKKRLISVGTNNAKTHPLSKFYGRPVTVHAEMQAIIRAKNFVESLDGMILVVARIKRNGEFGMARPCSGCQSIIKRNNIKEVWYTTENGWAKEYFE